MTRRASAQYPLFYRLQRGTIPFYCSIEVDKGRSVNSHILSHPVVHVLLWKRVVGPL